MFFIFKCTLFWTLKREETVWLFSQCIFVQIYIEHEGLCSLTNTAVLDFLVFNALNRLVFFMLPSSAYGRLSTLVELLIQQSWLCFYHSDAYCLTFSFSNLKIPFHFLTDELIWIRWISLIYLLSQKNRHKNNPETLYVLFDVKPFNICSTDVTHIRWLKHNWNFTDSTWKQHQSQPPFPTFTAPECRQIFFKDTGAGVFFF